MRGRHGLPLLLLLLLLAFAAGPAHGQSVNCSNFTDCTSCLTQPNSTCGYCSYTGSEQLTGACMDTNAECAAPGGTWLQSSAQCAASPEDHCGNYNSSCDQCAAAPMELNCGWCAKRDGCVAGSVNGPLGDSSCGANGGWAFLDTPCTPQAQCNKHSGKNCTTCIEHEGCGSCGSSHRCELGNASSPIDGDCAEKEWYFGGTTQSQCHAPSVDPCNQYSGCVACENATPSLKCGWCALTELCSTGGTAAPAIPDLCGSALPSPGAAGNWTFRSCKSDAVCFAATDCRQCKRHSSCIWCEGNSACVPGQAHPVPGHVCTGKQVPQGASCAAVNPSGRYPVVGSLAILFLTIGAISFVVRALLYVVRNSGTPKLGSRLLRRMHSGNFAQGCRRVTPTMLVVVSLMFKAVALGIDRWSAWWLTDEFTGDTIGHTFYGLLAKRTERDGAEPRSEDYISQCRRMEHAQHFHLCNVMFASSLMTLVSLLWSLFFSILLLVVGLMACSSPTQLSRRALLLWKLAGLSCVGSLFAEWFWALSAHLVAHYKDDHAGLGLSWLLGMAGFVLDVILVLFVQRMVTCTPEEQEWATGVVPAQIQQTQEGYVRMADGSHVSSSSNVTSSVTPSRRPPTLGYQPSPTSHASIAYGVPGQHQQQIQQQQFVPPRQQQRYPELAQPYAQRPPGSGY